MTGFHDDGFVSCQRFRAALFGDSKIRNLKFLSANGFAPCFDAGCSQREHADA